MDAFLEQHLKTQLEYDMTNRKSISYWYLKKHQRKASFEALIIRIRRIIIRIRIMKKGGVYLGQWVCLPVGLSRATCYSQRKWKVEAVADGNVVEEEAVEAGYGSDGTWCRCRWLPRWQGQPSPEEPAVSFETVECKWLCWPNLDNTHRDDTPTHTQPANSEPPPRNKQTTKQRITRKKERKGGKKKIKNKGWSYKIKQRNRTLWRTRLMMKGRREGEDT